MPCDSLTFEEQAQRDREAQLRQLEQRLKEGAARIAKVGNRVSIEGWAERGGWCDECAIRRLRQSADFRIRQMVAAAIPQSATVTFGHGH